MPNLLFKIFFDVDCFLKSLLNLLQYCFCCLCSGFVAGKHVTTCCYHMLPHVTTCMLPPAARTGTEPATPALEGEVLTIGSPEKSVHD